MTTATDWWALGATWLVFVLACAARLGADTPRADTDARDSVVLGLVAGGGLVLAGALLRAPPLLWWLTLAPFTACMLFAAWTAVRETYVRRAGLRRALRSHPLTNQQRVLVASMAASVAAVPTGVLVGVLAGDAQILRLAAAVGTLLSALLHQFNWVLYRRWVTAAKD